MASCPVSVDAGNVKPAGSFVPVSNGQTRALLVALHGRTRSSKYFDTAPFQVTRFLCFTWLLEPST
jgi:poly(3-hydroxybutyrate) depolymerase